MTRAPDDTAAVAIVLVNFKGWRDTIECLDSLMCLDYPNYHVFVVDNESPDGSFENLVEWCDQPRAEPTWTRPPGVASRSAAHPEQPVKYRVAHGDDGALPRPDSEVRLTLIRAGANLGFAGGCNVGIRAAEVGQFEFFWLLNTDTVVDVRSLSELVARAAEDPRVGLTGSTIRYYHQPDVIQVMAGARFNPKTLKERHIGAGVRMGVPGLDRNGVESELAYVMGASMLVSKEFVLAVGLMQEDYFLYFEEFDWALRGAKQFKLGYAPSSYVFHKQGATSSKLMPAFSVRLYYRNQVRFAGRFFPERLGLVRFRLMGDLFRLTVRGRWTKARIAAEALRDFGALAGGANPRN
jgi:GT2 family glycosyltransferase